MNEGDKNRGFSGLDSLVSDVDKRLVDVERSNEQKPPKEARSQGATSSTEKKSKSTSTGKTTKSSPPPPVSKGSGTGKIWVAFFGFIIFALWLTNQNGGSPARKASSSSSYTPSSFDFPNFSPAPPTLSTPPVGTSHIHSPAEIRYCVAMDIRLEALRPYMNSNSQIDAFNGIVNDYNSRCGSYQYRPGTLERAKREIEPYRSAIVANAWDGLSLNVSNRPQRKSTARRSQLTLDIQRALASLGYDSGVPDGVYGPKTKAAIEAFQRDYGIYVDGRESQILLGEIRLAASH